MCDETSRLKERFHRFDSTLAEADPPRWSPPMEKVAKLADWQDSLAEKLVSGRLIVILSTTLAMVFATRWNLDSTFWLAGFLIVPCVAIFIAPLVPRHSTRRPLALLFVAIIGSLLATLVASGMEWKFASPDWRDPIYAFVALQWRLEAVTSPTSLALNGLAVLGLWWLSRRIQETRPWLQRNHRFPKWRHAIVYACLVVVFIAPMSLLPSVFNVHRAAETGWIHDVLDKDIPLRKWWFEVRKGPLEETILDAVKRNPGSPSDISQLSTLADNLTEGLETDRPGAFDTLPLVKETLSLARKERLSQKSFAELAIAYRRYVSRYGPEFVFDGFGVDEDIVLANYLHRAPLDDSQLERWLKRLPESTEFSLEQRQRIQDRLAVKEFYGWKRVPLLESQEKRDGLCLFGKELSTRSLPELWYYLERAVILSEYESYRQVREAQPDAKFDVLKLPLFSKFEFWADRYHLLGYDSIELVAPLKFTSSRAILLARLAKAKTGSYPLEIPLEDSGYLQTDTGARVKSRLNEVWILP